MKWLSKCKKERKITQGGKGTAGGEQWDRKRKQEILLYPPA